MKALIAVIAAVALLGGFVLVNYSNAVKMGTDAESQLEATYGNNKNILAQYTLKVKEAASVPTMATEDLTKVMEAALEGRYGENGSTAVMQWIKESYPGQVDPVLYRNLQTIIEAGRTEFKDNQTKLLDQKRVYTNDLNYVWSGFWLKMAGYPKVNIAKYNIVTTAATEEVFKSGADTPVTLR